MRLKTFRDFLETKGELLSQVSEFLPFFAFPYVPDPKNHPVYRRLFEKAWLAEVTKKLQMFLDSLPADSDKLPNLMCSPTKTEHLECAKIRHLQVNQISIQTIICLFRHGWLMPKNDIRSLNSGSLEFRMITKAYLASRLILLMHLKLPYGVNRFKATYCKKFVPVLWPLNAVMLRGPLTVSMRTPSGPL